MWFCIGEFLFVVLWSGCLCVIFVCVDLFAFGKFVLLPLVARHWLIGNLRIWFFFHGWILPSVWFRLMLYCAIFVCLDFFLLLFLGAVCWVLQSLYAWIVLLLAAQPLFSASVALRSFCECFWCLPCGGFLMHVPMFGSACILTEGRGHRAHVYLFNIRGCWERAPNLFWSSYVYSFFFAAYCSTQAFVIFRRMGFSSGSGMAHLWFVPYLMLKFVLLVLCWLVFLRYFLPNMTDLLCEIYLWLCCVRSVCVVLFCDGRSCNDWHVSHWFVFYCRPVVFAMLSLRFLLVLVKNGFCLFAPLLQLLMPFPCSGLVMLILSSYCSFAFLAALLRALGLLLGAVAVLLDIGFVYSCLAMKQEEAWRQWGPTESVREEIKRGSPTLVSRTCFPLWMPWATWIYICLPLVSHTCLPVWVPWAAWVYTCFPLGSHTCFPHLSPTLGSLGRMNL